ncbi:hypothetical protein BpHYR1_028011 [Brachionus plicatilis]|uniref:Uncharacterized protein n=1 Tax=Brachionus plicatilis TaxID=10195 RepID=A0A3M7RL79_BRAPC|nr:hypothetical protein BpHYR1_028011 [Brachionus plicatilis]
MSILSPHLYAVQVLNPFFKIELKSNQDNQRIKNILEKKQRNLVMVEELISMSIFGFKTQLWKVCLVGKKEIILLKILKQKIIFKWRISNFKIALILTLKS